MYWTYPRESLSKVEETRTAETDAVEGGECVGAKANASGGELDVKVSHV